MRRAAALVWLPFLVGLVALWCLCRFRRSRARAHARPSCRCLAHAAAVDAACTAAAEGAASAATAAVPAWHFRMLNDRARNEAFGGAIARAVARGHGASVLDIGAGTGLLTLLALRAGAAPPVTAVEAAPAMARVAAATLAANGAPLPTRARLLRARSTALRVPDHLPARASLIVSEVVDSGLLGEGVLATMRHALRELLAPGGQVIPCGAVVYVEPVECAGLRGACAVSRDARDHGGMDAAGLAAGIAMEEGYTCETRAQLRGLVSLGPRCCAMAIVFGEAGGAAARACGARMGEEERAAPCMHVGGGREAGGGEETTAIVDVRVARPGVVDAFALTWRLFLDEHGEVCAWCSARDGRPRRAAGVQHGRRGVQLGRGVLLRAAHRVRACVRSGGCGGVRGRETVRVRGGGGAAVEHASLCALIPATLSA